MIQHGNTSESIQHFMSESQRTPSEAEPRRYMQKRAVGPAKRAIVINVIIFYLLNDSI